MIEFIRKNKQFNYLLYKILNFKIKMSEFQGCGFTMAMSNHVFIPDTLSVPYTFDDEAPMWSTLQQNQPIYALTHPK